MTNSIHICENRPVIRPTQRRSWLAWIGRALNDLRLRRAHRRAMADLLRHGGDAVLKDIGLSRATVVEEYYHPTRYRDR